MKRIVSVSLGSSKRNHRVETQILGENYIIERIGMDGDKNRVIETIRELDGKVDAFGMGGIDIYLHGPDKRYIIKDALDIEEAAQVTPILDGSSLKNSLEKSVIEYINKNVISLQGKKVLMTSAVDRYGMAQALHQAKADITFGDIIFGLNMPIPIRSFRLFNRIIKILLPIVVKMPFEKLYPTGKEQDVINSKYDKYYNEAEVIAGDYLYIKKYMPRDMKDKIIITNTVTSEDIEDLRARGASILVTTTPEFNGRSFGTNVIEALLTTMIKKDIEEITLEDYSNMIRELNFLPRVEYLNKTMLKEAK
jgi:hypothetical protein